MITTYGCATLTALLSVATPAPEPAEAPVARASATAPAAKKTEAPAKKAKAPAEKAPAKKAKAKAALKAKAKPASEDLLEKVRKYYADIDDYTADFIQVFTKVALSKTTESRGTLTLKKPGSMLWLYTKPFEKRWIVNGDTLYVVDPQFEQVFVDKHFKTEALERSISFLWGRGKLTDSFEVKQVPAKKHDIAARYAVLELVPKKGATYARLVLAVDPETGEVAESIIHETAGNTNHFKFKNAKLNTGVKAATFEYTPPSHFEIIEK